MTTISAERHLELYERGLLDVHQIIADNPSCVFHATQLRKPEIVKSFLENGANPSPRNDRGFTPLHISSMDGDFEIVQSLLDARADIEAVDLAFGATPIHMAAHCGSVKVLMWLLRNGARIDARAKSGETPLYMAAYHGQVSAVKVLLHFKANPRLVSSDALVPLEAAVKMGHSKVVEEFGKIVGFELGGGMSQGRYSLRHAADLQHAEMLKILLLGGVKDISSVVLCIVVSLGDEESFKVLLSNCDDKSEYMTKAIWNMECRSLPPRPRAFSCRMVRGFLDAGVESGRIRSLKTKFESNSDEFGIRRLFQQLPAVHAFSWGWFKNELKKSEVRVKSPRGKVIVRLQRATRKKTCSVLLGAVLREKGDGVFLGFEV